MSNELIGLRAAGDLLGVAHKSIRNRISKGTFPIPTVIVLGRRVMRRADVDAYIDQLFDSQAAPPAHPAPLRRGRGRPRKTPAMGREGGAV